MADFISRLDLNFATGVWTVGLLLFLHERSVARSLSCRAEVRGSAGLVVAGLLVHHFLAKLVPNRYLHTVEGGLLCRQATLIELFPALEDCVGG